MPWVAHFSPDIKRAGCNCSWLHCGVVFTGYYERLTNRITTKTIRTPPKIPPPMIQSIVGVLDIGVVTGGADMVVVGINEVVGIVVVVVGGVVVAIMVEGVV